MVVDKKKNNWKKGAEEEEESRVTRLGDFSPVGRLFAMGNILKFQHFKFSITSQKELFLPQKKF
jgi:hypothetical protein